MAEASDGMNPLADTEVASRLILDSIPALVVVMTRAVKSSTSTAKSATTSARRSTR